MQRHIKHKILFSKISKIHFIIYHGSNFNLTSHYWFRWCRICCSILFSTFPLFKSSNIIISFLWVMIILTPCPHFSWTLFLFLYHSSKNSHYHCKWTQRAKFKSSSRIQTWLTKSIFYHENFCAIQTSNLINMQYIKPNYSIMLMSNCFVTKLYYKFIQ